MFFGRKFRKLIHIQINQYLYYNLNQLKCPTLTYSKIANPLKLPSMFTSHKIRPIKLIEIYLLKDFLDSKVFNPP